VRSRDLLKRTKGLSGCLLFRQAMKAPHPLFPFPPPRCFHGRNERPAWSLWGTSAPLKVAPPLVRFCCEWMWFFFSFPPQCLLSVQNNKVTEPPLTKFPQHLFFLAFRPVELQAENHCYPYRFQVREKFVFPFFPVQGLKPPFPPSQFLPPTCRGTFFSLLLIINVNKFSRPIGDISSSLLLCLRETFSDFLFSGFSCVPVTL